MASKQHLSTLKQGAFAWNEWRKKNPMIQPDLREANLAGMMLRSANLSKANLGGADLSSTDLQGANLQGINAIETSFHEASLHKADLSFADLTFAFLSKANLTGARLWKADLTAARATEADFSAANLTMAMLRETDCTGAVFYEAVLDYAILAETTLRDTNLTKASICGLSAWNVDLSSTTQSDLLVTFPNEPAIMVDNLEVAQFIYLLLHNKQLETVVTGITSNIVLILGRFTPERQPVLEAVRDELRTQRYTPMLFNFEKPLSLNFSESLRRLARIARFVIADLSLHKSISQELRALLADTEVSVQPLLNGSRRLYNMFPDFKQYPSVLPGFHYKNLADLQAALEEKVIKPAEKKAKELGQPSLR